MTPYRERTKREMPMDLRRTFRRWMTVWYMSVVVLVIGAVVVVQGNQALGAVVMVLSMASILRSDWLLRGIERAAEQRMAQQNGDKP